MKTSTLLVRPAISKIAAVAFLSLTVISSSAQSAKSIFPLLPPSVSTIPSNGDLNPYGVAFVPKNAPTTGVLQPGDILVSNFNDASTCKGWAQPSCGWTRPAKHPHFLPAPSTD